MGEPSVLATDHLAGAASRCISFIRNITMYAFELAAAREAVLVRFDLSSSMYNIQFEKGRKALQDIGTSRQLDQHPNSFVIAKHVRNDMSAHRKYHG